MAKRKVRTREEERQENLKAYRAKRSAPPAGASPERQARFNRGRERNAALFGARELARLQRAYRADQPLSRESPLQPSMGMRRVDEREQGRREGMAHEAARRGVREKFGEEFDLDELLQESGLGGRVQRGLEGRRERKLGKLEGLLGRTARVKRSQLSTNRVPPNTSLDSFIGRDSASQRVAAVRRARELEIEQELGRYRRALL